MLITNQRMPKIVINFDTICWGETGSLPKEQLQHKLEPNLTQKPKPIDLGPNTYISCSISFYSVNV